MECQENQSTIEMRVSWPLRIAMVASMTGMIWLATAAIADDGEFGLSTRANVPLTDSSAVFSAELESLQRQIDALKSVQPQPFVCCPPEKQDPKFPTARLTGFFQADSVWFDQDEANKLAVGNGVASDGDVQNGADFRRARLAAVGQAWDNVSYMIEMDFAFPGRPSFMDVWLDIDDVVGSSNVRIGQFRQPFGMDGLNGVKDLTFLERPLPFAFFPFRQIGTQLYGNSKDELITWAISGYRFPTDTFGGNVGDSGGYGMATRVTSLLYHDTKASHLLHVGGAYCFIDPANNFVQYRNQPEVFVGETGGGALVPAGVPSNVPPFVDTGLIPTDNVNLFGAELAFVAGSFHAQSEAVYANVNQQNGPSLLFPGAYAAAGYFLTGESRPYNGKNGVFSKLKPNRSVGKEGGIGAWEIAGRFSYIDLNDDNIQGRRLSNLTAGLNWYLNPYTKFQLNYIHAMLNSPLNGDSEANVFAMRAQMDF